MYKRQGRSKFRIGLVNHDEDTKFPAAGQNFPHFGGSCRCGSGIVRIADDAEICALPFQRIAEIFHIQLKIIGFLQSIITVSYTHLVIVSFVAKERLDQMSKTGKHQGVIASAAAYEYAEVEDILNLAREKGEPPFIFLLDNIEDPHNPVSYTHLDRIL